MRNGNLFQFRIFFNKSLSSYRTYEEWKQVSHCLTAFVFVRSYRTYEEWKLRNTLERKSGNGKFLPYLWGMETKEARFHVSMYKSSYRTYEEWKHFEYGLNPKLVHKFLPYLWGMETPPLLCTDKGNAPFLPYLWGMETPVLVGGNTFFIKVLTVPMRNGNWPGKQVVLPLRSFLPYLWGMETVFCVLCTPCPLYRSYRTYEEWKQKRIPPEMTGAVGSYRTYEEWKLAWL